jgi:hypothetical protein
MLNRNGLTHVTRLAAVMLTIIAFTVLIVRCRSASCAQFLATGPTTVVINPQPLHSKIKRLGINLSGQSFYDSGQMLRNLTFRNPGFEGETWQSILHCTTVTTTSCVDENIYAVWPSGFLNGASFHIITGAGAGSSGTVTTSVAAGNNVGNTVNFNGPQPALSAGDFILVQMVKPGNPTAGWWPSVQGGAAFSPEYQDLPPATLGKQALRIAASGAGQSASISSYFDSYTGRSFVQLHGPYTITFKAKAVSGTPSVNVSLTRLDTVHGLETFVNKNITLTNSWQQFSLPFTASETNNSVGTVGLTFNFAGSSALLDDVALMADAAPDNPTAFRNEVVDTLRLLHPGVLRYMDNGTDFGSSFDNMITPPYGRQRAGSSTQQTEEDDIPIGLNEFLVLAEAVDAEPWYTMPAGTSPAEASAMIEFLAGDASTPYGQKRAALGQIAPWTSVFPSIHLELGNEQWNSRSFAGSTIDQPDAYGQRAASVFTAMRAVPSYEPSHFDLILGSWAAVPYWTGEELKNSKGQDSVSLAPYLFNSYNDASSTEAIFGPMFAEPEMISSRSSGYMAQQLDTVQSSSAAPTDGSSGIAIYETNLGTMSGDAHQADIARAVPSLGASVAVADHMLLMMRDLGITTQCLFALPEYINGFSGPAGTNETVPLWGAVIDMGGPTDLRRPTYLATRIVNKAILPTMLQTSITGNNPTWNQPTSTNDQVNLSGAHLIQTFAFADGVHHSLILINLSRQKALPVLFGGSVQPTGVVLESRLTGPAIDSNNEQGERVTIATQTLPSLVPAAPFVLPPWSITTLRWDTAQ